MLYVNITEIYYGNGMLLFFLKFCYRIRLQEQNSDISAMEEHMSQAPVLCGVHTGD